MSLIPSTSGYAFEILEPRMQFSGASDLSHSTASLSVPRYVIGAVTIDNKAIFAGGASTMIGADGYRAVDIFDISTGRWSSTTTPLTPNEYPATTLRHKASFVGSAGKAIYNATTGVWSKLNLPAPIAMDVAITLGNRVLLYGEGPKFHNVAYLSDANGGHFHRVKVPLGNRPGPAAKVGTKVLFADAGVYYDVQTHQWYSISGLGVGEPVATVVGTKALFLYSTGDVSIFDSVTDTWSTAQIPFGLGRAATTVGTKAIFAGGATGQVNSPETDAVEVYDSATGAWSTTTLSLARGATSATTIGNKAIFAGGAIDHSSNGLVPQFTAQSAVDIFTDTAPSAVLSGGLSGTLGMRDQVTVINTGDAALPAGYTIQLYASTDRTLGGAILVGSRTVSSSLAAGGSLPFNIRTVIPKDMPAGSYHLLAAVQDSSGNITPIAAEEATFQRRSHHAFKNE